MSAGEAVLTVIEALEACGITYILVGSYSTNAYGIPRSTQDADFVIELGRPQLASWRGASRRRSGSTPR
jgi:hypothetical protein